MLSDATRAVSVLAELAPSGEQRSRSGRDVTDRVVVPLAALAFLRMVPGREPAPLHVGDGRHEIIDLVKRARLHGEEADLRLGWLWLTALDDRGDIVRQPLVSTRVEASMGRFVAGVPFNPISLVRTGDLDFSELVGVDDSEELESTIEFGGGALYRHATPSMDDALLRRLPKLVAWATRAAAAAGHPLARIVTSEPSQLDTAVVVSQVALYLDEHHDRPSATSAAHSLFQWSRLDVDRTAFAALYAADIVDDQDDVAADAEAVTSSIVLTRPQESTVRSARSAQTTVVSGPPGSGKTQTVVAAALDVVERGGSVLVAAPSHAAVEALITLLTETPGPDPVVFGDASRRTEVADRLGHGGGELLDRREVEDAREASRGADRAYLSQRTAITDVLEAERIAADADPIRTFRARQCAPAWFEPGADHAAAEQLLSAAVNTDGWFANYRRRRAAVKLGSHAGAPRIEVEELARSLKLARAERTSHELVATGGIDLSRSWKRLEELDRARRDRLGRLRHAEAHDASRVDRRARATMGAVAAALRSGRARRRRRLATIDGGDMVEALPLWVGTLRDVEDLLPRTPRMFDLVIVDEASQVDQIQAAPALLRATRSMIVGDPKQLRHVSFLGDKEIADAVAKKGVASARLANLLDVRRMSLFDLGAANARTRLLDEHFRSTPHLIEFSSRRFYDGRLHIAKQHPSNHAHDHIHVERVKGTRSDDGVNEVEVRAAIDLVKAIAERLRDGEVGGSVGIVTPSRAQADRIEEVALASFDLTAIDALRLRTGTVHGFQGCERDLVIVSLALDDESPPGSRTFVANPNLFNVMVTRARERIRVITSLTDDDSVIGEYLRYASAPPTGPLGANHGDADVADVAADLRRAGFSAITNYPAGVHVVDLVVGEGRRAVAVNFGVHADGPDAHVERELALRRFGWRTIEVFASKWDDRRAELALELARVVRDG